MQRCILVGLIFVTMSMAGAREQDRSAGPRTSAQLYYGKLPSHIFINKWAFQACTKLHYITPIADLDKPGLNGINFNPEAVKPGDIIYVYKVGLFFERVHPLIKNPYILITQGDASSGYEEKYARYLDDEKLIYWFGVHAKTGHRKFIPIPLGTTGYHKEFFTEHENTHAFFEGLRKNTVKDRLVYMNFEVASHPDRADCERILKDKHYCVRAGKSSDGKTSMVRYFKDMSRCKFTLSPRGAGIDCWRTWEALFVGSIPIVKSSGLNVLYAGLPVLVINDWDELNEDFLNKKYKTIASKSYDIGKLYINYWKAKIFGAREQFLATWNKKIQVRPIRWQ